MKAVIMAGGEGTRLRPLTCGLPKPMVPIVGKPVMEHIINHLKSFDVKDIAVTMAYMPPVIMNYFGDGKLKLLYRRGAFGNGWKCKECGRFSE